MGQRQEEGFTAMMKGIHEWARAEMEKGRPKGEGLDEAGLALARKRGVQHPELVRVCWVDRVPHPGAVLERAGKQGVGLTPEMVDTIRTQWMNMFAIAPGLTLGYVVYVNSKDEDLLAHELVHVGQTEREGGLEAFLTAYVQEALIHGYRNNRFEVEAYDWPGEDA